MSFSVKVEAEALEKAILGLIQHTDRVAETHNALDRGTEIRLVSAIATSVGQ